MKITKQIHQLRHDFDIPISKDLKLSRFVNSLIIFDKDLSLIDAGTKDSFDKIKQYIESQGRSIKEVKNLILSHSHPDHIGSAYKIKKESNCEIFAHQNEIEWIENIELQSSIRPVPNFFDLADKPVKINIPLKGGELLNLGHITLEIINSPGHSPGAINIYFRSENILFTADNIPLKGDIPNYYDYKKLSDSLDNIMNNYEVSVMLSSWNEAVYSRDEQHKLIIDGKNYLEMINKAVKEKYKHKQVENLSNCTEVIEILKLPQFMINPIVNKSFLSHL